MPWNTSLNLSDGSVAGLASPKRNKVPEREAGSTGKSSTCIPPSTIDLCTSTSTLDFKRTDSMRILPGYNSKEKESKNEDIKKDC